MDSGARWAVILLPAWVGRSTADRILPLRRGTRVWMWVGVEEQEGPCEKPWLMGTQRGALTRSGAARGLEDQAFPRTECGGWSFGQACRNLPGCTSSGCAEGERRGAAQGPPSASLPRRHTGSLITGITCRHVKKIQLQNSILAGFYFY